MILTPVINDESPVTPGSFDLEAIKAEVRAELRHEMDNAVADIERRLAQARELEHAAFSGVPRESVHAEDLNLNLHVLEGYTLTSNSPTAGSIAWASLHIVYLGVDYTIANGSTALRYTWFAKPASGTTATLQSSNTLPTLGPNDTLVFVNNNGVAIEAGSSNVSWAVAPGTVGNEQIVGGIAQSKIQDLATTLEGILSTAERAEGLAEGAITQHFGTTFPWANGSVQDASATGDVYTVQGAASGATPSNGTSYKWSGPNGSPANQWILIEDAAVSKALADSAAAMTAVSGKTTTYYRTVAEGAPSAPSGGFTAGDTWVQTDNGGYTQRWSGSAWTAQLIGNAAIATGIAGSKIGSGISPANLTGTGTVPINGIPQIGPTKINAAMHLFY